MAGVITNNANISMISHDLALKLAKPVHLSHTGIYPVETERCIFDALIENRWL
jgi:hypothetical protein